MFGLTLVDHLRLTFGHVIYTHRAHTRIAARHVRWSRALKGAEIVLVLGTAVAATNLASTGSLPLGGLIGYVAIVTRQELMLFIVGGIFVIEAISVIMQVSYFKMSGGKRIFRVAPIHHHFHLGGWTETQTVIRFWLMSAIFAGIALATVKLR